MRLWLHVSSPTLDIFHRLREQQFFCGDFNCPINFLSFQVWYEVFSWWDIEGRVFEIHSLDRGCNHHCLGSQIGFGPLNLVVLVWLRRNSANWEGMVGMGVSLTFRRLGSMDPLATR